VARRPTPAKTDPKGAKPERAPKPLAQKDLGKRLLAIEPEWELAKSPKAPPTSKRLLAQLEGPDSAAREKAARALGELGAKEAIPALQARLADDSKGVQSAAAIALVRLGDRPLFEQMVKDLADPKPKVVAAAALALGLARRREAVPHLVALFEAAHPESGAAATALGLIGDPAAAAALLAALKRGFKVPEVCSALGRLGDARAVAPLIRALRHAEAAVRAEAARSLGSLKEAILSPDAKSDPEKPRAALRRRLDDENEKVRLNAALALVELGDREAGPKLLDILRRAGS